MYKVETRLVIWLWLWLMTRCVGVCAPLVGTALWRIANCCWQIAETATLDVSWLRILQKCKCLEWGINSRKVISALAIVCLESVNQWRLLHSPTYKCFRLNATVLWLSVSTLLLVETCQWVLMQFFDIICNCFDRKWNVHFLRDQYCC